MALVDDGLFLHRRYVAMLCAVCALCCELCAAVCCVLCACCCVKGVEFTIIPEIGDNSSAKTERTQILDPSLLPHNTSRSRLSRLLGLVSYSSTFQDSS